MFWNDSKLQQLIYRQDYVLPCELGHKTNEQSLYAAFGVSQSRFESCVTQLEGLKIDFGFNA